MSKILLVNLKSTHFPFVAAIAASALEGHGIDYDLIDTNLDGQPVAELVADGSYSAVVGAGSPIGFRGTREILLQSMDMFSAVRKNAPGCKTILCGDGAATIPLRILSERTEVDYLAYGTPEIWATLPALIRKFESEDAGTDIPGTAYRENGNLRQGPPTQWLNLKANPFRPNWEPFDLEHYLETSLYYYDLRLMPVVHGVGCPGKCTFCTNSHGVFRFRPVEDVVDEMADMAERYDFDGFYFQHGYFFPNHALVSRFADLYDQADVGKPYFAQARSDSSLETLKVMADSGCRVLTFGLESADNDVLRQMNKGTTAETAQAFVNTARKADINLHCTFMLGNVGESRESIAKTIDFVTANDLDFTSIYLTLTPGSELYRKAVAEDVITDEYEYITNWEHPFPTEYKFKNVNYLNVSGMDTDDLFAFSAEKTHEATSRRFKHELCTDVDLTAMRASCRKCGGEMAIPFNPWSVYNLYRICPHCWTKNNFILIDNSVFGDHLEAMRRTLKGKTRIAIVGTEGNAYALWQYGELFGLDMDRIDCFAHDIQDGFFFNKPVVNLFDLDPANIDACILADCSHPKAVADQLVRQGIPRTDIVDFLPRAWPEYVLGHMAHKQNFWNPRRPFYLPHTTLEARALGRDLAAVYASKGIDEIALGYCGPFAQALAEEFQDAGIAISCFIVPGTDDAPDAPLASPVITVKEINETWSTPILIATPAYQAQLDLHAMLPPQAAAHGRMIFDDYCQHILPDSRSSAWTNSKNRTST